ncbi:PrsW family glutamic-type intramembrane protease [Marinitenerispora sediminis]|uniref:PrsW family intramembrane metalloprotease n=1 Tax=Marinitenerispora sediminis TaxID=1931232 RepID=A0A368SYE8_9ACTN|nr:PrsW family glutamic-type intramembrane protease [Marinitenerispora sediminis]RCV49264.1 PrsW family intramembrane metalloprotease [Marinitenerispora sediminis]RCV51455.1 PrsW family intramembrane metalloprotease [Marinitenerispora sediminis]RCV55239.1 PrsW family intramembrane metalloprotease [Marinitenerispora sediminis]
MDEQAMLTRDLVLRVCANATEFDEGWIRADGKITAPFTASRDTALIDAVIRAGHAMGVDRLLVCRTRAEYAYEPVTVVPADRTALVELIRGWGGEPTDFLVVVEDTSAAVLVTATTLTVAAGPDDFVRALAGSDIAQARAAFAEEARAERDTDLLRAAHRYGCLEQGARHARGTRGPGPDLAERLHTQVDTIRADAPRLVAVLRTLRGVLGWTMVGVLLLAAVFVPGLPAATAVVLGMLWLLAQLAWLARSRTVGFAALVRTLALGALCVWPIALVEQAVAGVLGLAPEDPYAYAYVAVPVEEIGKLAPVALFWLVARRRFARMAAVDFLLLAAAAGAGFHLAETAVRATALAWPGDAATAGLGLLHLLPGGIDVPGTGMRFSGHGVTTGLVGAALGLAVVGRRRYGAWLWLLPPLALVAAALEHLSFNALLAGLEPTAVTSLAFRLYGQGNATRWLLLLLLVCAVVMDYRLARLAADATPRLPGLAPLTELQRRARGRAVRIRVRIPGDIAPVFRRLGLAWARIPVTLAETLSSIAHELAITVVAASRGPATLCRTWRFLRRRREFAMGAARAAGRPWRRGGSRTELSETEARIATALGVGPKAAAAAAAASLAAAHPALTGPVPEDGAGYALMSVRAAAEWLAGVPADAQPWAWAAAASLLGLLLTGWGVPRSHPSARNFLRDPGGNVSGLLGALAPGQIPYAAAALVGLALPRRVDRLLRHGR